MTQRIWEEQGGKFEISKRMQANLYFTLLKQNKWQCEDEEGLRKRKRRNKRKWDDKKWDIGSNLGPDLKQPSFAKENADMGSRNIGFLRLNETRGLIERK